jgi:CBS domain-containing protein
MKVRRGSSIRPPTVRTLMKAPVVAVAPEERLALAGARMRGADTSAAAVFESGRLVGVVTERDLAHALVDDAARTATVADYMTREPCTVGADEEAADAAALMVSRRVRHLPVLEDGAVLGFVSARDLLDVLKRRPLQPLACEPW